MHTIAYDQEMLTLPEVRMLENRDYMLQTLNVTSLRGWAGVGFQSYILLRHSWTNLVPLDVGNGVRGGVRAS